MGIFTGARIAFVLVLLAFFAGMAVQSSGYVGEILQHQDDIVYLLKQHLLLTLYSGSLAIVIGIALGILLSRPFMYFFAQPIMQLLNTGATIPTLALLALCMSFLGIGQTPAIFGLTVATLLPIVRNTFAGLTSVPAHYLESGRGMGMQPWQLLYWVEFPNALFVIFAGIRTALAINVGTVPLAFLIGAGGLGELIFTGISLDDMPMMLAGAIPTALLAILVDFLFGVLSYLLVSRGVNPARKSATS